MPVITTNHSLRPRRLSSKIILRRTNKIVIRSSVKRAGPLSRRRPTIRIKRLKTINMWARTARTRTRKDFRASRTIWLFSRTRERSTSRTMRQQMKEDKSTTIRVGSIIVTMCQCLQQTITTTIIISWAMATPINRRTIKSMALAQQWLAEAKQASTQTLRPQGQTYRRRISGRTKPLAGPTPHKTLDKWILVNQSEHKVPRPRTK